MLVATVVPTLALVSSEVLLLRSARSRIRRAERKRHEDALLERRRRAAAEIDVMRDTIAKRTEQERVRQGLVVLRASYGPASPDLTAEATAHDVADVTIPVQALVHNSQLHIPGGHPKSLLLGFYDPCYGEGKVLSIEYSFKGEMHRAEVGDTQAVVAPLRGHLVR